MSLRYKLYISVSDLVRAKESQRVIDELMEKYDNNKAPDAEWIRVTPFTNGFLRGINISIKCVDRDEAKKYRKEFNKMYKHRVDGLEREPVKCISLLDIEHIQTLKF